MVNLNEMFKDSLNELGIELTTDSKPKKTLSNKQKLLNGCIREIERLTKSNSLDYDDSQKGVRFWKQSNDDPNKVLVNLKYKGKIFGFGTKVDRFNPTYFKCDKSVESVIKTIQMMIDYLNKIDESDKMFVTL